MNKRLDNSKRIGGEAESTFTNICKRKNYNISEANLKQNKYEHWDRKITLPNKKSYLIDVKAIKDGCYNTTFLEFLGILGHNGWLSGKSDFIAFEQKIGFIYFKTYDLLNWALGKVGVENLEEIRFIYKKLFDKEGSLLCDSWDLSHSNDDYFVQNKEGSLYKLYSRPPWQGKPRHDVITKVQIKDMKKDLNYWDFV